MMVDKINKIKSIKGEVDCFHPILRELFTRMPNIINVEYTHGPNEMGADFVLSKYDETLCRTEYIGVIVKIGKISKNHQDIDDQIEDCEIERKVESGKKKVYISEIWIVTNDSISNQAKTKIHHKYNNKKINFISGENLIEYFNKYYGEYWTDISVEIGKYLRSMVDESTKIAKTIDVLDTSLYGETYIPQVLISVSTSIHLDPGRERKSKRLGIDSILAKENLIFVEGSMGTGKSKLIERVTSNYSKSEVFNTTKTIPFVTSIKEYISIFDGDLEKVIKFIESKIDINDAKYLIMLDALDEVEADEAEIIELISDIYSVNGSRDDCKVLVTSRPFDSPGIESVIDKYFKRFKIQPLTPKQIVSIVNKICLRHEVENHLISEIEKSQLFKVLPKTPISAIILGKLLSKNIQEVPSTMTELYSKYAEIVLGRWDIDKGLQSQTEYEVSYNVTLNIAKYFLDNELDKISIDEAEDMFEDYISSRNLKINKHAVFNKLVYNSEIFSINDAGKTISFLHRTFAEYFYACQISRDNSAVISEKMFGLYWSNVFFFYFGIKKDCPELIDAIEKIDYSSEEYKVAQIFSNGNLLLAAYLTPYDILEKSLSKTFTEAAELYNDVTYKKTDSPLVVLSKIQLLCIISHTMNSNYGYDFFLTALENRSLEISCITNPSEIQYTELFLINSALLSVNKLSSFDLMVNNYGKNIPMVLQVGIDHTAQDYGVKSTVVNRYIKQHRKSTSKNKSLRQYISDLYCEPIDKEAAQEVEKIMQNGKDN